MHKFSGWKVLVLILFTMGIMTGCGLKGDLYLPEGQVHSVKAG